MALYQQCMECDFYESSYGDAWLSGSKCWKLNDDRLYVLPEQANKKIQNPDSECQPFHKGIPTQIHGMPQTLMVDGIEYKTLKAGYKALKKKLEGLGFHFNKKPSWLGRLLKGA